MTRSASLLLPPHELLDHVGEHHGRKERVMRHDLLTPHLQKREEVRGSRSPCCGFEAISG